MTVSCCKAFIIILRITRRLYRGYKGMKMYTRCIINDWGNTIDFLTLLTQYKCTGRNCMLLIHCLQNNTTQNYQPALSTTSWWSPAWAIYSQIMPFIWVQAGTQTYEFWIIICLSAYIRAKEKADCQGTKCSQRKYFLCWPDLFCTYWIKRQWS